VKEGNLNRGDLIWEKTAETMKRASEKGIVLLREFDNVVDPEFWCGLLWLSVMLEICGCKIATVGLVELLA
jgi:hypothetical protein